MTDDGGYYLYRVMRGQEAIEGWSPNVLDLGHDVRIMFTVRTDGGPRIGFTESHRASDGRECGGSVTFDVPEAEGLPCPRWTVESWEPLTISPSVLCRTCGHHGFVRDGRWVPA
jgi:hypothetical protein